MVAVRRQDLFSGPSSSSTFEAAALASIAAERRLNGGSEGSTPNSHELVYARVAANSSPQEGQSLYYVPIESGKGETIPVLSTQVYCFLSSADLNLQPADMGVATSYQTVFGHRSGGRAIFSAEGPQRHDLNPLPMPESPSTMAYQASNVGPGQFVSAVKDLLSAAGLPLDLERSDLLNQAVLLKEKLALAEGTLKQVGFFVPSRACVPFGYVLQYNQDRNIWMCSD